eukprot:gene17985-biopygen3473
MKNVADRWRVCAHCKKVTQTWAQHTKRCSKKPETGELMWRPMNHEDVLNAIEDLSDHPFIKVYTAETPMCYDGNKATREVAFKSLEGTSQHQDIDGCWEKFRAYEYGLHRELLLEEEWKGICFRAVDFHVQWAVGYVSTWPQVSSAARNPRVVRSFLDNKGSEGPTGSIFFRRGAIVGEGIKHLMSSALRVHLTGVSIFDIQE